MYLVRLYLGEIVKRRIFRAADIPCKWCVKLVETKNLRASYTWFRYRRWYVTSYHVLVCVYCIATTVGNIFLHLQFVGIVLWPGIKSDVYARQFLLKSNIPCCVVSENVDVGTVVADPMVKKLLCSLSPDRSSNALKVLGMVPDKEFEPMSKYVSLVSNPMELGIVPMRALLFNVKISNAVMTPIELGIVPTKKFVSALKKLRDFSAPRLDGRVPVKRLRYRDTCSKSVKSLRVAGIDPDRKFVSSDSTVRDCSPPILVGITPVRRFSKRSTT